MEKVIGFKNSWILTEEGLKKTSMLIEEDKIVSIGDYNKEELIELDDDKIVIPGFIDQHIHGASSFDFIDCSVRLSNSPFIITPGIL
jgi:N-acetylglucosamine-6-phosphate deacetylase